MRKLFEHTVRTAVTMGLVDLAVQAVDGTKVVANASKDRTHDADELQGLLDRLNEAIAELEAQNEAGRGDTAINLPGELADKEVLREQVRQAMDDLAGRGRQKCINPTTPRPWPRRWNRAPVPAACWSRRLMWWMNQMTLPAWCPGLSSPRTPPGQKHR